MYLNVEPYTQQAKYIVESCFKLSITSHLGMYAEDQIQGFLRKSPLKHLRNTFFFFFFYKPIQVALLPTSNK